jgi:hypothetical protein
LVLLDLPGLLFFSAYTLLVLFWAEIYHQVLLLATYVSLYTLSILISFTLTHPANSFLSFAG